jgi:hypothetical protein
LNKLAVKKKAKKIEVISDLRLVDPAEENKEKQNGQAKMKEIEDEGKQ